MTTWKLSKAEQTRLSTERLNFLEKRLPEVVNNLYLTQTLLRELPVQVIVLDAEPERPPLPGGLEHITPAPPLRPDRFFTEHLRKLIDEHPGMLFHSSIPDWQVGLTLDKTRLVFVPGDLYRPYEQECLQSVGWSEAGEDAWEEEISSEDEETGEVYTPDWPYPVRQTGVWKARQVAHWVGEEETNVSYPVWANGTAAI
ncbi:MAG: hypothetical protein ACRDHW_00335 [Ktedonobacteraceae bacterium]